MSLQPLLRRTAPPQQSHGLPPLLELQPPGQLPPAGTAALTGWFDSPCGVTAPRQAGQLALLLAQACACCCRCCCRLLLLPMPPAAAASRPTAREHGHWGARSANFSVHMSHVERRGGRTPNREAEQEGGKRGVLACLHAPLGNGEGRREGGKDGQGAGRHTRALCMQHARQRVPETAPEPKTEQDEGREKDKNRIGQERLAAQGVGPDVGPLGHWVLLGAAP